ncbi:hypothetical protein HS041_35225 [Planomonospora sp. ID67723]|uniref:hypothetical protein n=1 Tax=Planomonospora sp. ID67723 TaxID=2738134 RepID=UPI0018C433BD|nr:hypothetical protein [Planomonospora sp. ID67723]MBG0832956.1 hypothetical protein [Planomonospora sp. ID67723]
MAASLVVDSPRTSPRRSWWRLVLIGPVLAASVLTVLAAATPGGNTPLIIAAVPAWLLSFCAWVALLAVRPHGRDRRLCLLPLAGGLVFAIAGSGIPLHVAFAMSEPALTRYAASLPERQRWIFHEEQAGAFTIDQVRRWNGVTELGTAGSGGMLEQCGFVHVPAGRVQELGASQITHLTGDWYARCVDFD